MESSEPTHPDFWNTRYLAGTTPWDLGRIPANLEGFLKRRPKETIPAKTRVLVPGCGSGHEVKALAEAGYDVRAIDLAPAAVARARQNVGPRFAERVIVGDFFTQDLGPAASFDLVYERYFLAALPPQLREAYRDRVAQLLKYGGILAGCFYYQETKPADGPPFGLAWGEADELFGRYYVLVKDDPIKDSLPRFAGRERWQERRRTAFAGAAKPA